MSPTHVPDLVDDAVDRALRADAEQWRVSHPAPSLDDAVRRLVAEEPAPARHRAGWWRPLAVAAAVLLLIGGAVEVVRWHDQREEAAGVSLLESAALPTLTRLPAGFRRLTTSPDTMGVSGGSLAPPRWDYTQPVGWWTSSRHWSNADGRTATESLSLRWRPAPAKSTGESVGGAGPARVHAQPADLSQETSSDGASELTTVSWVESGYQFWVLYFGPGDGSRGVRRLPTSEILGVADSLRLPAGLPPSRIRTGAVALTLTQMLPVEALLASDGKHLLVSVDRGAPSDPSRANFCQPYVQPVLVGSNEGSVTVLLASYSVSTVAMATERGPSCMPDFGHEKRDVPVPLDGPLGSRIVIDGSTGKPVTLSGS